MKTLGLILRNLGRNWLRTTLTAMAVVVLLAIYATVDTVTSTIQEMVQSNTSQTQLIVRERWVVPSEFPRRYVHKISQVEGVRDWTTWNFFAGYLGGTTTQVRGMATRMDNLREMTAGLEDLDPALVEAMRREKTGVLAGPIVLDRIGREVGQTFSVESITHPGKTLQLKVVGVIDSELWAQTIIFREDYYQQALGAEDAVNIMLLEAGDIDNAQRVAQQVEKMFENSEAELQVETESAGASRISSRLTTTMNIVSLVASVLLLDMVLILSNSIGITVRERRKEMAIFKVLGYQPMHIFSMVVGEATLIGAVSGALGAGLAWSFSQLNASGALPFRIDMLAQFPVSQDYLLQGFFLGAVIGLLSSALPAWNAQKVRVADVFAAQST
ncbi:FtsX-like permease family protein [Pseudobythopirellula maris]|uniref:FtsX-like permease family protein n=1 Tax=Pseudobythopirellula maris TaxID=2527991 RepID=A0A5C5ZQL3_9BACT|nr:ABC transporter permease [Pseudobythopirellula maris]TWT89842.1 FtsX-like permease family protein [Pseudobythopirellula maris]